MTQEELVTLAVQKCGSQRKLAELLGYSQTQVRGLLHGKIKLRPAIESALLMMVRGDTPEQKTVYVMSTDETVKQLNSLGDSFVGLGKAYYEGTEGYFKFFITCTVLNMAATFALIGFVVKLLWG